MGIADRVIVLDHGQKMAEGVPTEVRNDTQVIALPIWAKKSASGALAK